MGIGRVWAHAPRPEWRVWFGGSQQTQHRGFIAGCRAPFRGNWRSNSGDNCETPGRERFRTRPGFRLRRWWPGCCSNFGGSVKDTYSDLVNSPFGGKFAKALGLPRPAKLHRFSPGDAVSPGPILIVDADPTSRTDGEDRKSTRLNSSHVATAYA